jgi:hypothetical protein
MAEKITVTPKQRKLLISLQRSFAGSAGGAKRSPRKTATSRKNGRLYGGRPRKQLAASR